MIGLSGGYGREAIRVKAYGFIFFIDKLIYRGQR